MARLFRSKSCSIARNPIADVDSLTVSPSSRYCDYGSRHRREEEEEEEEVEEEEDDSFEGYYGNYGSPVTTPFIGHEERRNGAQRYNNKTNNHQFPVLEILMAALRKSLVTCSIERDDVVSLDISWPTDVQHVSHVTFDPFNGFLGLPVELQSHVPRQVPSASIRVFGVSAQSMQCSYDERGNSVPTILLRMQTRLYSEGGLKVEGIFRINADNSQEENVHNQLNKGVVPCGIDVHCLAGLIKAWFRELPSGVLDPLTPEQVMHCNSEAECTQLVNSLPTTEAALLDWAINLMADVVQNEHHNKMNARNIAMVFAPNMTKMADPLSALLHAVQVMNLLKTLILKTLRRREESDATVELISSTDHPTDSVCTGEALDRMESDDKDSNSINCNDDDDEVRKDSNSVPHTTSPVLPKEQTTETSFQRECCHEGILSKLSLRKSVEKLCSHPVFQLSKPLKKNVAV